MTRRHALSVAAVAIAVASAAAPAQAQALRTVEFSRQVRDSLPLDVRVDYSAGSLVLHGAEQAVLYQSQMAYDPARSEPVHVYDAARRELRLGARSREHASTGGASPELKVDLSREVPIDLVLEMGASETDLDLGGMRLHRLRVRSGASDAVLHFDSPNRVAMSSLEVAVGVAKVTARGLGNARARKLSVKVAVGGADLDFGGDWASDVDLDLQMAVGKASLRVPDDVGVAIDAARLLSSFDDTGFVKRGDTYYSTNWDSARRKLRVHSRILVGGLEVTRGAG